MVLPRASSAAVMLAAGGMVPGSDGGPGGFAAELVSARMTRRPRTADFPEPGSPVTTRSRVSAAGSASHPDSSASAARRPVKYPPACAATSTPRALAPQYSASSVREAEKMLAAAERELAALLADPAISPAVKNTRLIPAAQEKITAARTVPSGDLGPCPVLPV